MENKNQLDAETLFRDALTAPKYPQYAPYFKVVHTLRRKGMSWRDIASWLNAKGLEISHTTVRDFHNSELGRLPGPELQAIIDEIEKEAEALMVLSPFTGEEVNDE